MNAPQKALDFPGSDVGRSLLDGLGGALDLYGEYREISRADEAVSQVQPRPEAVPDQTVQQTNAGQPSPSPAFLDSLGVTQGQAIGGAVALLVVGGLLFVATR